MLKIIYIYLNKYTYNLYKLYCIRMFNFKLILKYLYYNTLF